MSFDCRAWHAVASELVSGTPTAGLEEAYWRTAVGRSYYCVYGLASRLLFFEGIPAQNLDTHTVVREKFLYHREKTRKLVGERLRRLYSEREKADYRYCDTVSKKQAEATLATAEETIGLLDTLLQPYRDRPIS